MFKYFEHFGDNGLVLGRRSNFLAPFKRSIKKSSPNVYLALAFTASGPNSFNSVPINETTNEPFYLGFKTYNTIRPNEANQEFLGIYNNSTDTQLDVSPSIIDVRFLSQNGLRLGTIYNQIENFNNYTDQLKFSPPSKINTASECYTVLIVKFAFENFGEQNQNCVISYRQLLEITDISYNDLRRYIKNYSPDNTGSVINLNNGSSAYTIPENFYIYWPFIKNRIKIQSILILGKRK